MAEERKVMAEERRERDAEAGFSSREERKVRGEKIKNPRVNCSVFVKPRKQTKINEICGVY